MGPIVLIAAILSLAAVVAGASVLVIRTLELIGRFRTFSETVGVALDEIAEKGDRVAERAGALGEKT